MGSIGLNRTTTILNELSSEIKTPELIKTAKRYPQTAAIQRLGYLLDKELNDERLAEALVKVLKDKKLFPVLLSNVKNKENESLVDEEWKVIKNIEIEADL
jgi:predicted transcriptional regulator of viral defense system